MKHECKKNEECQKKMPANYTYGSAVTNISFDENLREWTADNHEYCTVIYFCPFCGKKLPK